MADALRELLALAEQGKVSGLLAVIKLGQGDNRAGMFGDYKRSASEALTATFELERYLREDLQPFQSSR